MQYGNMRRRSRRQHQSQPLHREGIPRFPAAEISELRLTIPRRESRHQHWPGSNRWRTATQQTAASPKTKGVRCECASSLVPGAVQLLSIVRRHVPALSGWAPPVQLTLQLTGRHRGLPCFPQKFHRNIGGSLCLKLGAKLTLRGIGNATVAEHESPAPVRSLFDPEFGVRLVF